MSTFCTRYSRETQPLTRRVASASSSAKKNQAKESVPVQALMFQWGMRDYLVQVSGSRLVSGKPLCVFVPLTKVGVLESHESTVQTRVAEDLLQNKAVDKKKNKKAISPRRKRRHSQSFSAIRNQLSPLLKITEKKFLEVRDPSRDYQTLDENISLHCEVTQYFMRAENGGPALATFALSKGGKMDLEPKFHVEYKVVVIQGPRSWTVLRRYQYFRNLFLRLKNKHGRIHINCPAKHLLAMGRSTKALDTRMRKLHTFLQSILESPRVQSDPALYEFLAPECDTEVTTETPAAEPSQLLSTPHKYESPPRPKNVDITARDPDTMDLHTSPLKATSSSPMSPQPTSVVKNWGWLEDSSSDFSFGQNDQNENPSRVSTKEVRDSFQLSVDLIKELFKIKDMQWGKRKVVEGVLNMAKVSLAGGPAYRFADSMYSSMFCDENMSALLTRLCDICWPDGKRRPPAPVLSEADQRRKECRESQRLLELLKDSFPLSLCSIVGRARVDAGCYTLWEFLQNETLLKHVIYRFLDRVLHRIQISVDIP